MKRIAASAVTAVVLATGAVAAVPTTAAGAPAGFLQPTTSIEPARGCVRLTPGMNGIKVKMVQRRLRLGSRWETMDSVTIARVKRFQRR
nr:hypothetical protein [Actinomycetota bacterium]